MCNPPNGLYVKDGTDYLMQEHTYFWDNVLCVYRLGSSMTTAEYNAFHSDPRYSAMFADGGASTGTTFDVNVNNGSNGTTKTKLKSSIFDNIQSFLIPSQPQSKSKSALVVILVIAAICTAAFFLYKNIKIK